MWATDGVPPLRARATSQRAAGSGDGGYHAYGHGASEWSRRRVVSSPMRPSTRGLHSTQVVSWSENKERCNMEALTVLLLGVTTILGCVTRSVGVFVLETDQNRPVERQRSATPPHT
jgi:hypothetical protein